MKTLLLLLIYIYQKIFHVFISNILGANKFCRFSPTCSEYAKNQLMNENIFLALRNSTIRFLKCQPFARP